MVSNLGGGATIHDPGLADLVKRNLYAGRLRFKFETALSACCSASAVT